jgi:hypothetical protein
VHFSGSPKALRLISRHLNQALSSLFFFGPNFLVVAFFLLCCDYWSQLP